MKSMTTQMFARMLTKFKEDNKLSDLALGELFNVGISNVQNWRTGKVEPQKQSMYWVLSIITSGKSGAELEDWMDGIMRGEIKW